MSDHPVSASARALLSDVVDFAGLFPPAAQTMTAAIEEYARAAANADAWMLGRFVLPAGRLAEFAAARAAAPTTAGWRLSAIVGDRSTADVEAVAAFHAQATADVVDAVEAKPAQLEGIDWLAAHWPGVDVYVEVGTGVDPMPWLERIAALRLRAKIRTGGVTADAFPMPAAVAAFLEAAVAVRVPFKATAGLHHAVRGDYRLTYQPDAVSAEMYGYLNVLLAAAVLRAGGSRADAEAVLTRRDGASLGFSDTALTWGDLTLPTTLLADTRHQLAGFGSCSFREPADELRPLLGARA